MSRRLRSRALGRILGVVAAILFLTVAPVTIDPVLAAPISPSAVVIFGGEEFTAVPGLVLGRGQPDTVAGVCTGVDHSIRITAPKTIGYADVGVGVTNDCTLFVERVTFNAAHQLPDGRWLRGLASAGPTLRERYAPQTVALADTQHEIYGRHLMHEQFHVTTSLAHMQFTYWEGPSSVYSPSTTAAYCWVAGTGWTILNCYGWVELNGPSQVQQFTGGDFENQGGSLRHHLGAHPNAWIGGNGVFCDAVGSTMPFGWHDHCEYGRFW